MFLSLITELLIGKTPLFFSNKDMKNLNKFRDIKIFVKKPFGSEKIRNWKECTQKTSFVKIKQTL